MSSVVIVGGKLRYKELLLRKDVFISLLSGFLPKVMKRKYCRSKGDDCRLCRLNRRCAYAYTFEPILDGEKSLVVTLPDIKIPFAFRWQFEDRVADFSLSLFGDAASYAYEILDVISEIGEKGLGREQFRFDLVQLFSRGLYFENISEIENSRTGLSSLHRFDIEEIMRISRDMPNLSMRIEVLSNLDLARSGRYIRRKELFSTLYRRIRDRLKALYVIYLNTELPVEMKGLSGRSEDIINTVYREDLLEFKGSISTFRLQFLLGSYFNIGRQCAFGKGVYRVS